MSTGSSTNAVLVALLLGGALQAQERIWTLAGGGNDWFSIDAFGDFDGDGAQDILAGVVWNIVNPTANGGGIRILSGATGATLHQRVTGSVIRDAGDMDNDGQRDFAMLSPGPLLQTVSVNMVSFATNQILWFVYGPPYFGTLGQRWTNQMCGNLDLDGDGRPDLVAITSDVRESDVYAYNNAGTLLYRLPVRAFGWVALNVVAMPDMDGDGCAEFLVGCIEPSGRGAVVVVSGRTGAIGRISYGLLPGDSIGGAICNAGDVDQDGMADYAAASYWSSPLTSIVIYSGRTGAVIRSWNDYWTGDGGMIGNLDVDLDGVPDLLVGNGGWIAHPGVYGQVRAYSGRDGTVLWNHDAPGISDQILPEPMIALGVQPGSPYPVFAFRDSWYYQGTSGVGRVIAVRTNLPGAGPVTGTPCSSGSSLPQIGMRLVPSGSRITIAKGPPGAIGFLIGGPASQTNYGSLSLPLALDPYGLPGCSALVAPVVQVPVILGTSGLDRGYAAVDLPWIPSPSGTALAAQWIVWDPATGSFATTARHEFRVQ
jgi:hypothetical protein